MRASSQEVTAAAAVGRASFSHAQPSRLHRLWRVALALGLIGAFAGQPLSAQDAAKPIVHTAEGDVQGRANASVHEFLGIPFAAPPVGALRWQPPEPVAPWSAPLAATQYANFCAQPQRGVFAAPSKTEDCLYLNVFAPATSPNSKRPVMVWFYGGGLFSGESNDYDGSKLVQRGDVVVVTLNYRVGVFGFLSHPALNAEGHPFANYGIMDQQFALRWVQRNIAAFGGDPDNVTIFGQSGGGTSVMAQLQSPLAKGLFHKAINQSGTRIPVTKPEFALKVGEEFAAAAGCAEQTAACLRALPVETVLANWAGIMRYVADFPVVDGQVITQPAFKAFREGAFNRVPILTGLVQDEQGFFMSEPATGKALTADEYQKYAATFGAKHGEMLLRHYPLAGFDSPSLAEIAMAQGSKACTARQLDRQWSKFVPVYAYQFEDRTAPSYFPRVSYPMRAYHTAELQYLFPLFRGGQGTAHPLSAVQSALSDTLVDYWTSFARGGKPESATAPVAWDTYDPQSDNIQVLTLPAVSRRNGYGDANDCGLWDTVLSFD